MYSSQTHFGFTKIRVRNAYFQSYSQNKFQIFIWVTHPVPSFQSLAFQLFVNSSLQRTGEARLTRIALAIVWLFIFCHAWRLIPTIYEAIYPTQRSWPTWLHHVNGMSHSFILLNSAVNFLLYTVL